MEQERIRKEWEGASHGWARWEVTIASWIQEATTRMLDQGGVRHGAAVLDVACGAGSQTLEAARRVGTGGEVLACDISENMLEYTQKHAQDEGLEQVTTHLGAAEELDLPENHFDAAISRLGLMLFTSPSAALRQMHRALKPGGRVAVVVFTGPERNPFMARPMKVLLKHAGKEPPAPGQPGVFALGSPDGLEKLFKENDFEGYEQEVVPLTFKATSTDEMMTMMKEAFGAYRAVISDCTEEVQSAAWEEVSGIVKEYMTADGFAAPAEVRVASATKHA